MKHWYDKDAMVRELKPGETIIVLLLIPCHPLPILIPVFSQICLSKSFRGLPKIVQRPVQKE
jgi:hypothetical protein